MEDQKELLILNMKTLSFSRFPTEDGQEELMVSYTTSPQHLEGYPEPEKAIEERFCVRGDDLNKLRELLNSSEQSWKVLSARRAVYNISGVGSYEGMHVVDLTPTKKE